MAHPKTSATQHRKNRPRNRLGFFDIPLSWVFVRAFSVPGQDLGDLWPDASGAGHGQTRRSVGDVSNRFPHLFSTHQAGMLEPLKTDQPADSLAGRFQTPQYEVTA